MASKDTSGWQSLGGSDPTKYQATLELNQSSERRNPLTGQTDSKQKVIYVTDRATGSYDAYAEGAFGSRTLIYQYNPSKKSPTIVNQTQYDKFFTGKNSKQYTNTHRDIRTATLALAKENLSDSTSRKEYQKLQETIGYKSLSNTAEPSPVVELEVIPPLSGGEEQNSDSSAESNGTLTGGFLAPDGFSIGSNSPFTDFASLDGDAFLGTVDDTLPFEAGYASVLDLDHDYYNPNEGENSKLLLQYPEADLTSFGYDYIQIVGHKYKTNAFLTDKIVDGDYVAPKLDNFTATNGKGIFGKLGRIMGTIQLPMQPNLSESNSVDWNQDEINQIQKIGAGLAAQGITDVRNAPNMDGLGKAAINLMGGAGEAAKELLRTPGLAPFITAYFAGQAVGANVVGRSTGQVLNKNLELLFKGPKLRQFSFNFTFTPRTDTEAATVKEIIRFFKRSMAPQIAPERLFLYTPDIFQLKYIHNNGEDHPFMNRFKPCALTNFSANYTPGNSYMTYKDGSMTQYQIAMTFSELEPIYQHEQDGVGGTGY